MPSEAVPVLSSWATPLGRHGRDREVVVVLAGGALRAEDPDDRRQGGGPDDRHDHRGDQDLGKAEAVVGAQTFPQSGHDERTPTW